MKIKKVNENLDKEIVNKLQLGFIYDQKKEKIDIFERAKIIQNYLDNNSISQREFAKRFGFSHSTIQDWLLVNNITEEEHLEMNANGFTNTDIYRMLRNSKKEKKSYSTDTVIDSVLNGMINTLKQAIKTIKFTKKTEQLIKELRDVLIKLEQENKLRNDK